MYFSLAVLVLAAAAIYFRPRQPVLSEAVLHHAAGTVTDLLTVKQAAELRRVMKEEVKVFNNIGKDRNFYQMKHEHTGEAMPLVNGTCEHHFFVPSHDGKLCVLPGRIDVAQHYIKSGGFEGLKENFDVAVSRLQSFAEFVFDMNKFPITKELFESEGFMKAAQSVCPSHQQHIDGFQMNFIIQVPGQTVAMHTDAPYFWGATRFLFPQWVLIAMVHSGLFVEKYINQVQVVAYFHEWNASETRAGDFVFWRENSSYAEKLAPNPRAATVVDGAKVIHAATIYNGPTGHGVPPLLDKEKTCVLRHDGDDKWSVSCDGVVLQRYVTDDLRLAIVYRARCFENKERELAFKKMTDNMTLDDVLGVFRRELARRGKLASADAVVAPLELAMMIVDEFIRYPISPTAWVPVNVCALPRLLPWTQPVIDLFC